MKDVQQTLFGTGTPEQEFTEKVEKTISLDPKKRKIKKEKKMTIIKAVTVAVGKLPKTFSAYRNPYSRSLVSEVRKISGRPFVSSVTIMRRLRESNLVKCTDPSKSIYERL